MKRICNLIKKRGTFSLAYTLAEVVIVMLVIAVVAGVSIKITKAKLDNIISYTYYMGYSTLRNVTGQMLGDFNVRDENYTDVATNVVSKFLRKFQILSPINEAIAEKTTKYWCAMEMYSNVHRNWQEPEDVLILNSLEPTQGIEFASEQILVDNPNDLDCESIMKGLDKKGYVVCPNLSVEYSDRTNEYWDYSRLKKAYARESSWCSWNILVVASYPKRFECRGVNDYFLYPVEDSLKRWPICVHEEDVTPTSNTCANQPSEATIRTEYCQNQREWQGYPTCEYNPVPCNQEGSRWSQTSCACVPETPTLPRKGANFCEKFLDYTNTKSTAEECNGDAIASNLTDFTDKKADIVLRNGLKLYNVRQNPAPLPLLAGNNQGGSYELADGTTVNVNEFGYTVYLDIDGEKGSSTLWEDVFPFYITMAGKVIPLYHTEGEKEYGGTSRQHLMTSVQKEVITTTGHRQVLWIRKSVPFKESACTSGYINSTTPYCSGVSLEPTCNEGANVCILKYVSPVKFF